MLDPDVTARIRHIFLHYRPHVSISSATALLGWSRGEMNDALAGGEIETMITPLGKWIGREELMAKALEIWSHEIIEEALGDDAERVLPRAVRLAELRARVPRYQLTMLQYFAERDRTTISSVLTKELEGVASANAGELTSVIPDFAAAIEWPDPAAAKLPC